MTGLYNRSATLEILSVWPPPFGLVLTDLNGFKSFNACMGHTTGDAFLVGFASQLAGALPAEPHVLIGRFGGDEFLVAVQDAEATNEVAEVVRTVMARPQRFKNSAIDSGIEGAVLVKFDPNCIGTALRTLDLSLGLALEAAEKDVLAAKRSTSPNGAQDGGRSRWPRIIPAGEASVA